MSNAHPLRERNERRESQSRDRRMLQKLGAEQVGFLADFSDHAVLLQFRHRGRQFQLKASAAGWAAMWLKENPWTPRRRLNHRQGGSEGKALRD
jgi:hypothetical protein